MGEQALGRPKQRLTLPVFCVILCGLYVMDTILVASYTRTYKSNPTSAQMMLMAEVLKLVMAVVCLRVSKRPASQPLHTGRTLKLDVEKQDQGGSSSNGVSYGSARWMSGGVLHFGVPALCYFVSNNLSIYALSLLPAYSYMLLTNLKIITTGLMSVAVLKKPLSTDQQISLVLLFIGLSAGNSGTGSASSSSLATLDIPKGIVVMLIVAMCSATATVYTEWVMNHSSFKEESIHQQNAKLYAAGVLLNGIYYLQDTARRTGTLSTIPATTFTHMRHIHWVVICGLAFMGLVVSAIIKFHGNLTKVYASALSMFVAAWASQVLLGETAPLSFYLGAAIAAVAVYIYNNPAGVLGRLIGPSKSKPVPIVLLFALAAGLLAAGMLYRSSAVPSSGHASHVAFSTSSSTGAAADGAVAAVGVKNAVSLAEHDGPVVPSLSEFSRDHSLKLPREWEPIATDGFKLVCPVVNCSLEASCSAAKDTTCCNHLNLEMTSFLVAFLHSKGLDKGMFGVYGTALGAVRDGTIMSWTPDVDLAISAETAMLLESRKVRQELYEYGYFVFHFGIYRLCPHANHPSHVFRATFGPAPTYSGFPPERVYLDMYSAAPASADLDMQTIPNTTKVPALPKNAASPAAQDLWYVCLGKGWVQVSFKNVFNLHGVPLVLPDNVEEHLAMTYGVDWRVPHMSYHGESGGDWLCTRESFFKATMPAKISQKIIMGRS